MARRSLPIVLAALLVPGAARAALFAVFSQRTARPGDRVELRMVGSTFVRAPARHAAIRVFLVENGIADSVTSPRDPRLRFVGTFDVDRTRYDRVRDAYPYAPIVFRVPSNLAAGTYTAAYDCPPCGAYSFGRTFFSSSVTRNVTAYYRPRVTLVVETRRGTAWKTPVIVGGLAVVAAAAGLGVIRRRRGRAPSGDRRAG
jgi:hypothetical protein